jgi:hypothetical protein
MARFPYHERNVQELGKLIARAALNDQFRKSLQDDPSVHLSAIGLPKQTTELLRFNVVDGKQYPNATALPFRLNQKKLDSNNEDYLAGLSRMLDLN